MTNNEYVENRLKLIDEVDELLKGCEGCQIHYELNIQKKITELTNTCKACPLGAKIGEYGEMFLQTTKDFRNSKNI